MPLHNRGTTMKIRILMVEDDHRTRMALVAMLEKAGYQVTPAADGEAALEILSQHRFDIVITDIRMGDIDGIEVLNAARTAKQPPAVILLTGYGSLETAIAALRAGAHDYLLKPCAPTALLSCVANALQRRDTEKRQNDALHTIAQIVAQVQETGATSFSSAINALSVTREQSVAKDVGDRYINVGNLCIDQLRHTILFNNKPLHVTPTEYTLLYCLAEARERVLGYREIVRYTHGRDMQDDEAHLLLKSHIRNIRRKINPQYLISVRGVGYILTAPDE